ncbi:MAG: transglutaminase-like domain-containing protein [Acidobacteriota bacterium]|nr:transglutaminase-like domain-containing protein [Acidobacteriota bacterium]
MPATQARDRKTARAVRVLSFILLSVFSTLPAAGVSGQAPGAGTQWYVLRLGGTPVGYVREETSLRGAGPSAVHVSDSTMKMVINRLGSKVEIEALTKSEETADGRLRKIAYELRASVLATKSEALIKDGVIEVKSQAGGKSYSRSIAYSGELLGPEGVRRLSLAQVRKPGDRIEFQTFSSESEAVSRGSQTALAWEDILLDGKIVLLLKVEEVLAADGVKTVSWLDEKREVRRQEAPTPFGTAEIVGSTKEEALAAAGGGFLPEEIYSRSIIHSNIRLPRARTMAFLKVRLTRRGEGTAWPEFAGPSPKAVERTAKTIDLELRRPDVPPPARLPLPKFDADREFLEPNATIQSDDLALRRTALEALAGESDVWKAGLKLERWVAEHMSFDLGIALAPSSELFKNRRGTCLGYATLLAALARAAGIPSRVVIGYVYVLGIFGGHAWTEIRVGGTWMPLDAAIVSPGAADAAHIGLSASSFRDGSGSLVSGPVQAVFGQVDIRILEYAGPDGKRVVVPETAKSYTIEGDVYHNSWLGLSLVKPSRFAFGRLDAVWPDTTVVEMAGPDGAKAVLQEGYFTPWAKAEAAAAEALARFAGPGKPERATKEGRTVLSLSQGEKAAAAVLDGPVFWMLTSAGRNAAGVLAELLRGFSLNYQTHT